MLPQYLSKLYSYALAAIALAKHLVGALAHHRELWLDSNLGPVLQKFPLNVVLATIIVVLGLLAIFITPILPLLVLGVVAFFLSFDRKATTRFVMMGGLSTGFGALATVGLPSSPIMSIKLSGSSFATTFSNLDPYVIFVIAAIGMLTLGLKIELTPVQRDTLTTLINLHRQESRAVKGKEIGELMDRNPETIRIQMRSLKALNLVESVTGPKGGYTATAIAYDALSMDNSGGGDEVIVCVIRNGILVEGASATEIAFNNVTHSIRQSCVSIHIFGNIKDFRVGDEVEVGPTPVSKLYIRGKVTELDNTTSWVVLDISEMISIPRLPVKKVARRAVRISPNISLREASRILVINGAQEALVDDSSLGLVNMADITRAVAEGKTDLEVREIMTPGFLTINSDAPISEAVKMLGKTGAKQLVVLDRGALWGIITPRDLMESLTFT
ncbi:MAG TPA: CBS domain-containing protein [Methanothrix sp.]|nr:CBS domain-containing protein [Methanothrix sp.]